MLDSEDIDWPKPFNFSNAWLLDPKFIELVKEWWGSLDIQGWGGFVLSRKLSLLKSKIKEW